MVAVPNKHRRRSARDVAAPASISATDAARGFGRLVDRVREERAVYVVERGGVPVVRISPVFERRCTVRDLVALVRGRPPLDGAYLRDVEAVSKTGNRPAIPSSPWE